MTITDEMVERAENIETEFGEPPYSRRHSLGVLLGRAVSMIAPSLSQGESMIEADRMLRAALEAALMARVVGIARNRLSPPSAARQRRGDDHFADVNELVGSAPQDRFMIRRKPAPMTDIPSLIEEADKVLSVPASLMGGESFVIPIDLFVRMKNALSRLTVPPLRDEIAGLLEEIKEVIAAEADFAAPAYCAVHALDKAAAALEQQAREIERLNVILANHGVIQLEKTEIMLAQKERIAELESEADNLDQRFTLGQARIKELQAELERFSTPASTPPGLAFERRFAAFEAERDRETGRAETAIHSLNECREEIARLEAERDRWKNAAGSGQLTDLHQEALARRAVIEAATIEQCAQVADKMTGRVRSPITTEIAVAIRALAKPSGDDVK